MAKLTLDLKAPEKRALFQLAQSEYRKPGEQAALIIRRELERCGALPSEPVQAQQPAGSASG